MNEENLRKLCLAWSLAGLFILLIIANFSSPELINLSEIENNLGKTIKTEGELSKVTVKDDVTFFELVDDYGAVDFVAFDKVEGFNVSDKVIAEGEVAIYKGDYEIILDFIKEI